MSLLSWMTCSMRGTASVLAVAGALTAAAAHAEDITLTVWSHEADSKSKVAWRELAARNFEEAHPGVKVKITWYQKEPLFSALNTALRAGQGPDAFYGGCDGGAAQLIFAPVHEHFRWIGHRVHAGSLHFIYADFRCGSEPVFHGAEDAIGVVAVSFEL